MYKTSIELFRVHSSFKVKFCLIIKGDSPDNYNKLINKFNYLGNDYLRITPFPFITIDITSKMDKNEEWNSNRTFNLNRRELYLFICKLNQLYSRFTSIKELFYYDVNDQLQINKELAYKYREYVVCGNKTILMQACVVENENNHDFYEGIFLSVNSMDYFSYLTYGDIGYLLYELKRIDMSSLTIQVINTYYLTQELESKEIKKTVKAPVTEETEDEIVDIKKKVHIDEPNTIPEI